MKDCFYKLVNERQSCREFNDKALEEQTVMQIVKTAMLAPSACNSQPWKMHVVLDAQKRAQVFEALNDRGHNMFLDKAKAFVVISEKQATLKESVGNKFDRNHFVKYDIGQLCAYITLTAKSLGVESCIIGWINQDKLRSAVGYSQDEQSNIVVALGYSDIAIRKKARKTIEEIVEII